MTTAEDIAGREYDWLAVDADGCVGLFSTAGSGYAPPAFLADVEAHKAAIRTIVDSPARTRAEFAPSVGPDCINTWRLVAERGVYAFDGDPNGGPYRLVAAPQFPVRASALPAAVREVAERIRLAAMRFSRIGVVDDELLRVRPPD